MQDSYSRLVSAVTGSNFSAKNCSNCPAQRFVEIFLPRRKLRLQVSFLVFSIPFASRRAILEQSFLLRLLQCMFFQKCFSSVWVSWFSDFLHFFVGASFVRHSRCKSLECWRGSEYQSQWTQNEAKHIDCNVPCAHDTALPSSPQCYGQIFAQIATERPNFTVLFEVCLFCAMIFNVFEVLVTCPVRLCPIDFIDLLYNLIAEH